jgi:hypothetical protein
MKVFRGLIARVVGFFGAVQGSVRGVINGEELVRAIISAVSAGFSVPSVLALVPVLIKDVPLVVPSPAVSGLLVAIITLIADLYRRKAAGSVAT